MTSICTYKECFFAGNPQPKENFTKNKNRPNGLNAWCKVCRSNDNKKNKPKWQAYNKQYKQDHKEEIEKYEQEVYKEKRKELLKNWKHQSAYYETYAYQLLTYKIECRRDPNNSELLQCKCTFCKEWFNPKNSSVQNRLSCIEKDYRQGEAHLYCSEECKVKCPIYHRVDEPKPEDRTINYAYERSKRPVQKELREMVLERDEYACQKCGATDVALVCHHFTGVQQNPIESADVDNCITVCEKCDSYIHSQPGCRRSDLRCKK